MCCGDDGSARSRSTPTNPSTSSAHKAATERSREIDRHLKVAVAVLSCTAANVQLVLVAVQLVPTTLPDQETNVELPIVLAVAVRVTAAPLR